MDIKTFQLATGVSPARATQWSPLVSAAMEEFGITTFARVAAFLAQVGHESGGFTYTKEIWGPTPAQLRYEGRTDLGNTVPGDGSKFRGRGLIQTTGRVNYLHTGNALGVDLISSPELLEQPALAARSAAWWWSDHGLNLLADAGEFLAISIRINGKNKVTGLPNGWDDRQARWAVAKEALGL